VRWTAFGDQDSDAYNIKQCTSCSTAHLVGQSTTVRSPGTSHADPGAVKRFQKQAGLKVTGVANHVTWRELIQEPSGHGPVAGQVQGAADAPLLRRMRHQATLWHNGVLWNLVVGAQRRHRLRDPDG
jgi:hypothetical protein